MALPRIRLRLPFHKASGGVFWITRGPPCQCATVILEGQVDPMLPTLANAPRRDRPRYNLLDTLGIFDIHCQPDRCICHVDSSSDTQYRTHSSTLRHYK
jgi:hypothetical protein